MSTPVLSCGTSTSASPACTRCAASSLDVRAGEVVALLGENGAGKSTLMKIVGGIEQPDAGDVLDRRRAGGDARRARPPTAHGIAFIHQELNLLDNLDVAGNVLLGREPTGWGALRLVDRRKMRDAVRPPLERLGLDLAARHAGRRPVDRAAAARRNRARRCRSTRAC